MRHRFRATVLATAAAGLALAAASGPALASPAAEGRQAQAQTVALRTVACRGGSDVCRARVSLAGGASNERVVIRLTDADLSQVSVRPNRSYLRGAYLITSRRFRLGGSEYVFTLNAVRSIPVGSYLLFTFRAPRG